jgi:hypothetical protein
MPTIAPPTDLAEEIEKLKSDLAAAERARVRPEDRHAADVRIQLENKKRELQAQQAAEAQAEQDRQHAIQLTLLQELGTQESAAKAEVLQLQRELATLPGRLQMAQAHHSELCRMRAGLKGELGL